MTAGDGVRVRVVGAVVAGVVVAAALVVLLLAWLAGGLPGGRIVTEDLRVESYRAASDEATTITVVVGAGSCTEDVKPRLVSESADTVVVDASGRTRRGGSCTAELLLLPFDVTLAAPIGDRTVHDGGHEVPRAP